MKESETIVASVLTFQEDKDKEGLRNYLTSD